MTPADPREVLNEVKFRAMQIDRLLGMLAPGSIPSVDEHQAANKKPIATIDAAIGGEG